MPADYAALPRLVLHVRPCFGWMTLLAVHAVLVGKRELAWHRNLGIAGATGGSRFGGIMQPGRT